MSEEDGDELVEIVIDEAGTRSQYKRSDLARELKELDEKRNRLSKKVLAIEHSKAVEVVK